MVQKCVVLGCGSKWYPGCSLIFHSFPKNPIRRKQWLSSLQLKNKFYETAKICSNHFGPADYLSENRLKSTAIPFFSKLLEQSERTNDESPAVSVCYMTIKHETIFPSAPSTSHHVLSNRQATPEEPLLISNTPSTFSPIAPKNVTCGDNLMENIFSHNLEVVNVSSPNKRSYLREILETKNVNSEVGDENTPPYKPLFLEKSVQVTLATKREEILRKRNKLLVQKIVLQKKAISNMKSLLAAHKDF